MKYKLLILGLILIIIDQLTKFYFINKNFTVIPKILYIKYSTNPGLIFGFFSNNIFFIYVLPVLIIGILIYFYIKNTKLRIGLMLVVSGILGNLIGRIIYGYVIDFIFIPIYPPYNISLFNISDALIVFGVIYLVLKIK